MDQIVRTPGQMGAALRQQRRGQSLTQNDVASRTQLRQATISALENGEAGTQLNTLTQVLAALDLELVLRPRSKASAADIENMF